MELPERVEARSTRPHVTAERPLDGTVLTFDIPGLLKRLQTEAPWRRGRRNAMTLAKSQGLRVVLVAMRSHTNIPAHHADGPISIEVMKGRLRFRADSRMLMLRKGQLLTLRAGVPHAIEAVRDAVFLLTLSTNLLHPAEH
jgi:quercetin dioxygenase-like cupin family protein